VSPVKYELGFYIPDDSILLSHRLENLKSYMDRLVFTIELLGFWILSIVRNSRDPMIEVSSKGPNRVCLPHHT
jgi:hypothetical protein